MEIGYYLCCVFLGIVIYQQAKILGMLYRIDEKISKK